MCFTYISPDHADDWTCSCNHFVAGRLSYTLPSLSYFVLPHLHLRAVKHVRMKCLTQGQNFKVPASREKKHISMIILQHSQGVKCIFWSSLESGSKVFFLGVFMLYRYCTPWNRMMAFSQHWAILYNTFYNIMAIGMQNNGFTRFEK